MSIAIIFLFLTSSPCFWFPWTSCSSLLACSRRRTAWRAWNRVARAVPTKLWWRRQRTTSILFKPIETHSTNATRIVFFFLFSCSFQQWKKTLSNFVFLLFFFPNRFSNRTTSKRTHSASFWFRVSPSLSTATSIFFFSVAGGVGGWWVGGEGGFYFVFFCILLLFWGTGWIDESTLVEPAAQPPDMGFCR